MGYNARSTGSPCLWELCGPGPRRGARILSSAWTIRVVAAVLAAVAASASAGQGAKPPASAPVDMSASDIGATLTRILLDKPSVPITRPKEVAPPAEDSDPFVEGSMVVDRTCRLARDAHSGWMVLTFDREPGRRDERPRRALPCELLQQMEPVAAWSPQTRFRVSGETTVFKDHGYLLLTKATILPAASAVAASKPAASEPVAKPASKPATRPATTQPATRPAPSTRASSNDVLSELMSEKIGRPVQTPIAPLETSIAPSVAPSSGKPIAGGRTGMIVDRLVRIVPEETGAWYEAKFESDNTLQDPPMRLMPCGFLEQVLSVLAERRRPAAEPSFRVSGAVTRYHGKSYLLLRAVLPERRMNRF